jgi:hypothetical protein
MATNRARGRRLVYEAVEQLLVERAEDVPGVSAARVAVAAGLPLGEVVDRLIELAGRMIFDVVRADDPAAVRMFAARRP